MTRFRSVDLVVQEKPDGSPVSDADRAVEQALRARLRDERPDHGITGEELGSTGSSDWRWYLDPIDGTSDFVAGGSDWKTLIALAHADRVLVGVVSSPALGSRWWATRGDGAFRDGVRLSVSRTSRLADATVSDDWRQTIARGVNGHPLTAIAARSANFRPREGHTFLEVAQGRVDVGVGIGGRRRLPAERISGGGRPFLRSQRPGEVRCRRRAREQRPGARRGAAGARGGGLAQLHPIAWYPPMSVRLA